MRFKLAVVAIGIAMAAPALAQVMITPTPGQQPEDDQQRPRRGFITPDEQERLEQRRQQREEQQPGARLRTPEDYNTPRQYEGRAVFSGTRPGKCPLNGSVRATVRGNIFDVSLTFPIERDAIHGFISGTRLQGAGGYGYSLDGSITDAGITGTATKKQQQRPSPDRPLGVSIPFIQGPSVERPAPPPPKIQDCTYTISLSRVS